MSEPSSRKWLRVLDCDFSVLVMIGRGCVIIVFRSIPPTVNHKIPVLSALELSMGVVERGRTVQLGRVWIANDGRDLVVWMFRKRFAY